MTTTVIDSLVVELGLDPRKFTEGQRDAMAAFQKGKAGALEFGKSVEQQGAKISDIFGIAKKGVMGIVGGFIGAEAASFIDHIINMDAATGRMAKSIGTSVENLGIWQSMIRQVGGSAEEATSTLSALQDQINNVRMGSGMFDNQFGFLLSKIGGAQGKNADQIMRELQAHFASEISSGRMKPEEAASQMRWIPGMNQNMINLLLSDLKKIEDAARAVGGATKETADAAAALQSKFNLMVQALERFGAKLIPVIDLLMKPIGDWSRDDVKKLLPEMTFDKGSLMDRLDTWLWGEHNTPPVSNLWGGFGGEKPASFNERFGAMGGAGSAAGRASPTEREAWIRSFAATLGIDPDTALKVSKSEGFGAFKSSIPGEQSFGDFQLHITPGGRGHAVGDEFRKQTGLDPMDPANEKAMDMFALQWAASHGWKDFHGAANTGIGPWSGIGARSSAAARGGANSSRTSSTSTSSTEMNIGTISINAPNATDADGIAREIGPAMKRSAITSPANSALV